MTAYSADLWARAQEALKAAELVVEVSADAAASRAYYAAFYAASALLSSEGQEYTKHTGVESAVHRDLVKAGRWPKELGRKYSSLVELRVTGDYGGHEHVSATDAASAIASAREIVAAVAAVLDEA